MKLPIDLDRVRLILAVGIVLVILVLVSVVAIVAVQGIPLDSGRVVGILLTVGTLIGILTNLVGTRATAGATQQLGGQVATVEKKVDNHIDQHLTDAPAPEVK